jgi:hypothetical protein
MKLARGFLASSLWMDGGDWLLDECTSKGIDCVLLPPHTTDQVQSLGLKSFGLQKREAARCRLQANLHPQSAKVVKFVYGYQRPTCPDNIAAAFRRTGIGTEWSVTTQGLTAKVSHDAATEDRHWQFSKGWIKCPVNKARLYQQTKISHESGK